MLSPVSPARIALFCAVLFSLAIPASRADNKSSADAMRLVQRNCLGCHNAEKHKGGLNLTTRDAALKGSDDGPVITPKKPDKSKIIEVLNAAADPHMPPK